MNNPVENIVNAMNYINEKYDGKKIAKYSVDKNGVIVNVKYTK